MSLVYCSSLGWVAEGLDFCAGDEAARRVAERIAREARRAEALRRADATWRTRRESVEGTSMNEGM
jgi:hypothetical protein